MSISSADSVWLSRPKAFINPQEFKIFAGDDATVRYLLNQYMDAVIYFTFADGVMHIELANDKYEENILPQASLDRLGVEGQWQFSNDEEQQKFKRLLKSAATSREYEAEGIWFRSFSQCCGYQECCIYFQVRMVAKHDSDVLYCALLSDNTEMQHTFNDVSANETKFRKAAELANIYAWEYDIATHEMRPCTRCMRDLGLPPVLKNYPDPVFEAGIFPRDYEDMYRNWHERLAQGEPQIQGVIPLTPDRIPFHVRYTTEFDKDGKPVKAYGSATLAVDNEKEVELREIISTLTMRYATVLKVDLTSGDTEVLNVGHESSVEVQNLFYEKKIFKFEDIKDDYLTEYVHPDDVEKMKSLFSLTSIKSILSKEQDFSHSYRIIRKQKTIYMVCRLFSMADKKHAIIAIRSVDDVMKLKLEAEDKLKLDVQSVSDMMDVNNAVINNMADNMGDVMFILERIVEGKETLDAAEVEHLRMNFALMAELARDIKKASELKLSMEKSQPETFDLYDIFNYVKAFALPIAKKKNIELYAEENISSLKYSEVVGNELYVKRVLFNIVHNALKYSPEGAEIHCSAEAKAHGGRINCRVKISDEGIGISPEFQNKMYDAYTQENRQVDPWANGQGLGLYVVKQLLAKIGGNVAIYSAVDVGTIVTVTMSFDIA
ncbi:periplasmic sensor hybrid histidine kinase [Anaerovibrio sp. JC8]|uniref:sensor histidine kinase n=1 Tax=Anaerovibrio sp. JC8 TaxID=1240085 RepID=UPI000A0DA2F2|nr:PAS domain-containing sensor histidine kinase [Anaerovibrio sp. JC8]ORU01481.1 periplasmic sensor hybrid histidine kinase [Anaerovibrio sp. JC8]